MFHNVIFVVLNCSSSSPLFLEMSYVITSPPSSGCIVYEVFNDS